MLERPSDDRGPAASGAVLDDSINEIDELVWESDGDLLTHPTMVAVWYQHVAAFGAPFDTRVLTPPAAL